LRGGALYVDQHGGSFALIDNGNSDDVTFDTCGVTSPRSLGGGLYLRYRAGLNGEARIGGSRFSFSNCFSTNGTQIFIDAENLEFAIRNTFILDFDYNDAEKNRFIGMSNDNYYSFTSLYEYDCLIQNRIKKEKGNTCLDECSLECPSSTVVGNEFFQCILFYFFK
jgi:hypothetical protein